MAQAPLLRWVSWELQFDRLVRAEASMGRRNMWGVVSLEQSWSSDPLFFRGPISEFPLVLRSVSEAHFLRWGMLVALAFRLNHSKAVLNQEAIRRSGPPLVTLRSSDTSLRAEVRTPALFLQRVFWRLQEFEREYLWPPRTEGPHIHIESLFLSFGKRGKISGSLVEIGCIWISLRQQGMM